MNNKWLEKALFITNFFYMVKRNKTQHLNDFMIDFIFLRKTIIEKIIEDINFISLIKKCIDKWSGC